MKIAVVHMDSVFADVKANMKNAKRKIEEAKAGGAELILFPEFFTTGFAFSKKLLDSVLEKIDIQKQLSEWSKELNIIIGGSYLNLRGEDAYNTFSLTFPNGQVFKHDKDIPTVNEHFCYTYGDENNVFKTPIGNIGVAMCWEQMRYNTLKRMAGKVDIVLAGSAWWSLGDSVPEESNRKNHELGLNAPIDIAKILHVPVIHASHNASYTGVNFPKGDTEDTRRIVGATQVIDENGNVTARRLYNEEAGIIFSDVNFDNLKNKAVSIDTDKYWIPELPKEFLAVWDNFSPVCEQYYEKVSKPYYIKMKDLV